MKKSALRQQFLQRQRLLTKTERGAKSRRAIEYLFESISFDDKQFVNCFVTLEKNNEFDTSEIFKKLRSDFSAITLCAPKIDFETNELENIQTSSETAFAQNKWQILEPAGGAIVEPQRLNAVLVPLIAFDKRGFRVGYGKGFYDKFLTKCRADCLKIGLSLFPPVEKIQDAADFDVKLDACATPQKVYYFNQNL